MTPSPLQGLRVLVTRPIHQQKNFIQLLNDSGAQPIAFPLIKIKLTDRSEQITLQLKNYNLWDVVIFVSPNAVTYAHALLPLPWRSNLTKVAAIGGITRQTLLHYGQNVDILPKSGFSSESLLELDEFQSIYRKRIAIISGDKGRTLLKKCLSQRGATIETIEVYRNRIPEYSSEQLNAIFAAEPPHVICITSNQGLFNLVEIVKPYFCEQLSNIPLVVNSQRCNKLAQDLDFKSKVIIANNPGDQGQLIALQQWFSKHFLNQPD